MVEKEKRSSTKAMKKSIQSLPRKDRELVRKILKMKKEELIKNILKLKTRGGQGVGIYGREVCELCGQKGNFNGWADAMSSHGSGRFVCPRCRGKVQHGSGGVDSDLLDLEIKKRKSRYCSACGTKTPIDPKNKEDVRKNDFRCLECTINEFQPDPRLRYLLWEASRSGEDALRATYCSMIGAKRAIDEMMQGKKKE
ncbi:hypothetical protein DRH29_00120 [candidate division Kazan bacterium]|uniref:Uncharacterized protein n=1 Tax=candidate division Kazan bacterium TaxID=2202143 RepID=A0A420ZDP1_UNCK3|nr:MAG: hypothetical protein DRH29_00120 [candidate division Kazan bacterium]